MGGSDFLEFAQLPFSASASDHLRPSGGSQLNTTSPYSSRSSKNQHFFARSNRSTRLHHAKCRAVCDRERGCIDKREPVRHAQKVGYRHRHQFATCSRNSFAGHSPPLDIWVRTNTVTNIP